MADRKCIVSGCDNTPRSGKAEWCKKHYHRWYRHGSVDRSATTAGLTASNGRRYRTTQRPDHPIAGPSGRVYVHRITLYDAIGPGAHPCHWCSRAVRWEAGKGQPDHLTVDHVNGMGDDNRLANLVPSCIACNSTRAHQARSDLLAANGWWSNHDTIAALGTRCDRVVAQASDQVK